MTFAQQVRNALRPSQAFYADPTQNGWFLRDIGQPYSLGHVRNHQNMVEREGALGHPHLFLLYNPYFFRRFSPIPDSSLKFSDPKAFLGSLNDGGGIFNTEPRIRLLSLLSQEATIEDPLMRSVILSTIGSSEHAALSRVNWNLGQWLREIMEQVRKELTPEVRKELTPEERGMPPAALTFTEPHGTGSVQCLRHQDVSAVFEHMPEMYLHWFEVEKFHPYLFSHELAPYLTKSNIQHFLNNQPSTVRIMRMVLMMLDYPGAGPQARELVEKELYGVLMHHVTRICESQKRTQLVLDAQGEFCHLIDCYWDDQKFIRLLYDMIRRQCELPSNSRLFLCRHGLGHATRIGHMITMFWNDGVIDKTEDRAMRMKRDLFLSLRDFASAFARADHTPADLIVRLNRIFSDFIAIPGAKDKTPPRRADVNHQETPFPIIELPNLMELAERDRETAVNDIRFTYTQTDVRAALDAMRNFVPTTPHVTIDTTTTPNTGPTQG